MNGNLVVVRVLLTHIQVRERHIIIPMTKSECVRVPVRDQLKVQFNLSIIRPLIAIA